MQHPFGYHGVDSVKTLNNLQTEGGISGNWSVGPAGALEGLGPLSTAPVPDTVSSTTPTTQSADGPPTAEEKEASADPDAQHMGRGASLLSEPEAEDTNGTTDKVDQQGRSEHDLSVATGYTGLVFSFPHLLCTSIIDSHGCSSSLMDSALGGCIRKGNKPAWRLVP